MIIFSSQSKLSVFLTIVSSIKLQNYQKIVLINTFVRIQPFFDSFKQSLRQKMYDVNMC